MVISAKHRNKQKRSLHFKKHTKLATKYAI